MSNKLIAFVGNPNVGKSVIFNKLTGQYSVVSNYSGTSVDVTRGTIKIDGTDYQAVDTPGIYSLMPLSEDEQVTRDVIIREKPSVIVQVCDIKNLERSLHLFFELSLFNIPIILVLNMYDEAINSGIRINKPLLEKILQVPVIVTAATLGYGLEKIIKKIPQAKTTTFDISYTNNNDINCIENVLKNNVLHSRAISIYLLSGDKGIYNYIPDNLKQFINDTYLPNIKINCNRFNSRLFNDRNTAIKKIVEKIKTIKSKDKFKFLELIGNLMLNPFIGSIILLFVLYIMYEFIGVFVAGTVVDYIQTVIFKDFLNPIIINILDYFKTYPIVKDFIVGEYGLWTVAITYSFAIIFPIITGFFLFLGILEDSGYLPRLSVMLDRLFKFIGLNGKAVLPMILGLGCGTMAVLSARILETKKERLIILVLLSLAIPCSAQLGVILAMLSAISYKATIVWFICLLISVLGVGKLLSFYIKGESNNLIIELPSMRIPSILNIFSKIKMHLQWYLKEVVPLFIIATTGLFFIDKIHLLNKLEIILSPIIVNFLGLPIETTSTFIMGFLRRDYGASGIFIMAQHGLLTNAQVVITAVVITLFVPCIAQSLMVIKEYGLKMATLIFIAITTYAVLFGGVLRFVLKFVNI
jgi:ferrous iron transport protein B